MNNLEWQILKGIGFVCAGLLKDYTKKTDNFPILNILFFLKLLSVLFNIKPIADT